MFPQCSRSVPGSSCRKQGSLRLFPVFPSIVVINARTQNSRFAYSPPIWERGNTGNKILSKRFATGTRWEQVGNDLTSATLSMRVYQFRSDRSPTASIQLARTPTQADFAHPATFPIVMRSDRSLTVHCIRSKIGSRTRVFSAGTGHSSPPESGEPTLRC